MMKFRTSPHDPPPTPEDANRPFTPLRYGLKGKAELEVQHNGNKSIKSIKWTLLLIVKANSDTKIRSYTIRSKKEIRPGETVKMTTKFWADDLNEWRKPWKDGSLQTLAEIQQVNYSDGSTWLRPER